MGGIDGTTRQLGDFVVEDEIGRGGMGVVYRARQISMGGRIVALKVLPSLIGYDESSVARFRREAEAAGRLAHPGIVPVYAVGEEQGVHYFAMELVDGPSLEALLDAVADRTPERLLGTLFEESGFDQVFPLLADSDVRQSGVGNRYARSCARIGAEVASALAFAHRSGVIHRDLKPSNVLLRSSGQPVLVDFGLARDERTLGLTQSGDAIGTPSYMAPEQACGKRSCDGRTDVYGLGATLYEMLTLRPPFAGAHPGEIMRRIVEEEPAPVRSLNPRVPEDLARIVACCLEKEPDARYASIEAVELDLRNFLAGRPVLARSPNRARRLAQFVTRHRRALLVGGAVLVATSLAFTAVGLVARQTEQAEANRALDEAGAYVRNDLRVDLAEEAYGRARALLGETSVLEARKRHIVNAFGELYARGLHDDLVRYLDLEWSTPFRGESWWNELRVRAEGRGTIPISGLPTGAEVELRRFLPDRGLEPRTREWVESELLPLGDWIVEIKAPGMAPVAHRFVVERAPQIDLASSDPGPSHALVPLLVPADEIGPNEALVPMASAGGIAIRRAETTEAELERWIAQIADPRLRREVTPDRAAVRTIDPDEPVRGLSWRAGRALAITAGAHVPSYEEYLLAATADLTGLAYPWGPAFDWERVAASPTGALAEPVHADSPEHAGSASLYGVQHLVGNVAELVAPDPDGRGPLAVGGSYKDDDPSRLRVDARYELEPHETSRVLGLRLARFIPPADDPVSAARAAELLRTARREWPRATVHEWTIRRGGEIAWELFLAGQAQADAPETPFVVPVATPGFRMLGAEVHDAHERLIESETLHDDGDYRELELETSLRRGETYRIVVSARLEPREGLFASGAHHRLRIPLKASPGHRVVHVLRLPSGCRVDRIEPSPTLAFHEFGAPVMVWDLPAGANMRNASVVFRLDGSLATPWPSFEEGREAFETLTTALAPDGDDRRAELEQLLDPSFVLAPHGARRDDLLKGEVLGTRFEGGAAAIEDVTAVGSIVSVFASVDWIGPEDRKVRNWPVHAMFVRTESGLRAVAFGPRVTVDAGRVDERRYAHESMGAALDIPAGVVAQRDAGGPWELQLHLSERRSRKDESNAWIEVRGFRAPTDPGSEVTELEALDRLTAGAAYQTEGGAVGMSHGTRDPLWPNLMTLRFDGLRFSGGATGLPRRERWHLVERGYRWFLIRCVAVGASPEDADREFRRAEAALFEPVVSRLELGGAVESDAGPR